MEIALAVAISGALGALSRWLLTAAIDRHLPAGFPHGTLVVNVLGCLLLGWAGTLLLAKLPASAHARAAVATGFLGAFTTFSTFAFDTVVLWRAGESARAVTNVGLSLGLGLAAVALGVWLATHARS